MSDMSKGYDAILDFLAKQEQERTALEHRIAELEAQLDAIQRGQGVNVVINGVPFYLSPNVPINPGVAIHVVPDLSATSVTATAFTNSFLLSDTDEHPIFEPKTA